MLHTLLKAVYMLVGLWVGLLVIGLVLSVVEKVRQGSGAVSRLRERQTASAREHSVVAAVMGTSPVAEAAVVPVSQPVIAAAPPFVIRPRAARIPVAPVESPEVQRAGAPMAFRGMFERGNLVRAIVAAEVLGPPKSLQEQSIWSPRHSEPSI